MQKTVVPDQQSEWGKKQQVEKMFDSIAFRYDFLNRLLSFRIDTLWRKKVRKMLQGSRPEHILDIATGTGDLAIELSRIPGVKITGLDLSQGMLDRAAEKVKNKNLDHCIHLVKGDSEALPFQEHRFDAVTVAFGVRNFEDLEKGLKEIHRVLKPEGQLLILEFSKVKAFPIKQFYQLYFGYITPAIGRIFSRNRKAYSYLTESVKVFPEGEQMLVILRQCGFKQCICTPLTFGIASIYQAVRS
ncbi:MAG TPA: bifunctional demethylmenaquinone methyltransferase/2-methoxy-6-polyprenyl-1,4-benzoquinol methylase UbiE [Chitinophagaceae bacterium]|nr:bifunctional demethylmenaquinone methyltransferase/2-methoxy-6-polyprenyl-1,4-benzoquinol methylase UbiE [Chitinophagaceae bacterium]